MRTLAGRCTPLDLALIEWLTPEAVEAAEVFPLAVLLLRLLMAVCWAILSKEGALTPLVNFLGDPEGVFLGVDLLSSIWRAILLSSSARLLRSSSSSLSSARFLSSSLTALRTLGRLPAVRKIVGSVTDLCLISSGQ